MNFRDIPAFMNQWLSIGYQSGVSTGSYVWDRLERDRVYIGQSLSGMTGAITGSWKDLYSSSKRLDPDLLIGRTLVAISLCSHVYLSYQHVEVIVYHLFLLLLKLSSLLVLTRMTSFYLEVLGNRLVLEPLSVAVEVETAAEEETGSTGTGVRQEEEVPSPTCGDKSAGTDRKEEEAAKPNPKPAPKPKPKK
jgi:hypothetical protein